GTGNSGDQTAQHSVDVFPRIEATATKGQQVHLYIDKSLVLPVSYTSTNNPPSSDITSSLDKSLPVGKTPSSYNVNQGNLNYNVPIVVPQGTNNMAPSLSVSYNSMGINGLLGYGWNLSGIHAITRVGQTIYHNGYTQGVTLTNSDWFEFDGNRLVPTNSSLNGLNGTKYSTEQESFTQTTSYGSTAGGGPQYFQVQTKDGLTIELGNTADSKLIPAGSGETEIYSWYVDKITDAYGNYMTFQYNNSNGEVTIQEIDYTGNTGAGFTPYNSITFSYDSKTDANSKYCAGGQLNSTVVLNSITVNSNTTFMKEYRFTYYYNGLTLLQSISEEGADRSYLNPLIFSYLADDNTDPKFQTTNSTSSGFRQFILLDYNGDGKEDLVSLNGSGTGNTAWYNYDNGTDISVSWNNWSPMLNSSISNATTTFTTGTAIGFPSGYSPTSNLLPLNQNGAGDMTYKVMDFNGDGREDMAVGTFTNYFPSTGPENCAGEVDIVANISNGSTFTPSSGSIATYEMTDPTQWGTFYLDFNGDRKMDVFNYHWDPNTGIAYWRVWLNAGVNNPAPSAATGSNPNFEIVDAGQQLDFSQAFPMDLDGDGREELVNVFSYRTGQRYIVRYEGSQASVPSSYGVPGFGIVIQPDNPGFEYVTNQYTGILQDAIKISGIPFALYGDFNGDGISDAVYYYFNGSCGCNEWQMFLGKGGGQYTNPGTTLSFLGGKNPTTYPNVYFYAVDVNGDGKTDILEFTPGSTTTVNVFYSMGNKFSAPVTYTIPDNVDPEYCQIEFGDFNGDGTNDLFYCNLLNNPNTPSIFYFYQGAQSKYLHEAVDGYNVKTKFYYQPLSAGANIPNETVYTQPQFGSSTFPNIDFDGNSYVVTQVTAPDGTGVGDCTADTNSITYSYQDAIINSNGKGFIGFLNVTSTNTITQNATTYTISNGYTYDPTFLNLIPQQISRSVTSSVSTNVLLSQDNYTYTVVPRAGSVGNWVKLLKGVNTDDVAGVSTTTTYQYDNYGNITDQNASNAFENQDVSTPSYVQSGAWIPSRAQSTTTTISRPLTPPYPRTSTYNWDASGHLNSVSEDVGVLTSYTYDATGTITEQQITSSGLPTETTQYAYDLYSRFPINIKNPLLQITQWLYDPLWGKPTLEQTPDGMLTQTVYDAYGRVSQITTPDNVIQYTNYNWSSLAYNPNDPFDVSVTSLYNIIKQKKGNPSVTTYYDMHDRQTRTETDGFSNTIYTIKSYDAMGNVYGESNSYQTVSASNNPIRTYNSYDDHNRLIESDVFRSFGGPIRTTFSYQYNSGVTSVTTTRPDLATSTKATDPTGLLVSTTDNAGNSMAYTYYSNRQLYQTSIGSVFTSYQYDTYGRRTQMTDGNTGTINYQYNAYGQLIYQKDSKGNVYNNYAYDALGRLTSMTGPEGVYKTDYVISGNGLNNIKALIGANGITYFYSYDKLRRLTQKTENINSIGFVSSYEYDTYSHLIKETYPSGFGVAYNYNSNGYETQANRVDNGNVIWQANAMNAMGQYINYTTGYNATNQVTTQKTYSDLDYPVEFQSGTVQDLIWSFDISNGNMVSRSDNLTGLSENFNYDNMDRLNQISGPTNITASYDYLGNITDKSDIGSYEYNGPQPNAVSQINTTSSLISMNTQTMAPGYTPFDKIATIAENNYTLNIAYGPNQERKQTVLVDPFLNNTTRYFVGDYEQTILTPASGPAQTIEIHYIQCGGNLVAMYVIQSGAVNSTNMYYTYTDNLGSILKVTADDGTLAASQSFDAWGNYRDPITWLYTSSPTIPTWLYRGFTGHEHLQPFALINMNGRVYDPLVARMLSPDMYVQFPTYAQSFNRYSYCLNNPLIYTDPNGELFGWEDLAEFGIGFIIGYVENAAISGNWASWQDVVAGAETGAEVWLAANIGVSGYGETTGAFSAAFSGPAAGFNATFAGSSLWGTFITNRTQLIDASQNGSWNSVWLIGAYNAIDAASTALNKSEVTVNGINNDHIFAAMIKSGGTELFNQAYSSTNHTWNFNETTWFDAATYATVAGLADYEGQELTNSLSKSGTLQKWNNTLTKLTNGELNNVYNFMFNPGATSVQAINVFDISYINGFNESSITGATGGLVGPISNWIISH
ncbi:MAG TPA: FG-GAP-like repeat-containing protein, partial [Bacteroidia bacterium]|nr:FG-GAP-like repeat-containing protein [Bacteroidia bacterium]